MNKNTLSLKSHLEEIQAVGSLHPLLDKFQSRNSWVSLSDCQLEEPSGWSIDVERLVVLAWLPSCENLLFPGVRGKFSRFSANSLSGFFSRVFCVLVTQNPCAILMSESGKKMWTFFLCL